MFEKHFVLSALARVLHRQFTLQQLSIIVLTLDVFGYGANIAKADILGKGNLVGCKFVFKRLLS